MAGFVTVAWGVILPESTLQSHWFVVLTGFVAVNTLVYVTLSIAKSLPRLYPRDFLPRRHARRETRSIYPDAAP